jgi:hypothetical protein
MWFKDIDVGIFRNPDFSRVGKASPRGKKKQRK